MNNPTDGGIGIGNPLWLTRLSVFNLYTLQTSHQFYLKFTSNNNTDQKFQTFIDLLNTRYISIQN
jgi:hypothetical protein